MVFFNIKTIYLKILSLEKQLNSAKAYKNSLKKLKKDIQEAVKLGKKPEVDLLKVQYKLEKIDLAREITYQKMLTVKGDYLPEIYFKASAQRNMGNGQYKDLWQIGFIIKYKIFDFGVRKNRYIQTKLELEKQRVP